MTKRRFPHNTCPASRHVEMLADQLLDSGRSAMIESEPENCAVSMHSTVEALYGARDRLEQLESQLAKAESAIALIATPKRPDGTWNRDREACRVLAAETLEALK